MTSYSAKLCTFPAALGPTLVVLFTKIVISDIYSFPYGEECQKVSLWLRFYSETI